VRALICLRACGASEQDLADFFLKFASGFTMIRAPSGLEEAALIYYDIVGPQLGKALAVRATSDEPFRLLHAIRYLAQLHATSPMSAVDIWAIVAKELRDITRPNYVSLGHDVAKKVYPSILRADLERLREDFSITLDVEDKAQAFFGGLALAAMCSGIHRLGLALRQVAAQALAFELLRLQDRGGPISREFTLRLLAALSADTYLWYPLMCAQKAPSTLRGELYSAIVGLQAVGPIADFFRLGCVESTNIPEKASKLAARIASSLEEVGGESLRERAEHLCEGMKASLRAVYPREPHGEALAGLVPRVLGKLEGLPLGDWEEAALLMTATEQLGPGLLNFIISFLREKGVEITEKRILYTPATLLNRLIIAEYLEVMSTEASRGISFLPVGATNPELTYRIADSALTALLDEGQRVLVIMMGHMSVVASLAKACAKHRGRERVRPVVV